MRAARKRRRRWGAAGIAGCVLLSGLAAAADPAQEKPVQPPASESLPTPRPTGNAAPPATTTDEIFYHGTEVLPIDLPTALRLADASNPTIALARQRVEEAFLRVRQAQLLWLPNLEAGSTYLRHDGEIQNAAGVVFGTSKSSVAAVGGAVLRIESNDALFGPLIARRLAEAQAAASQAVNNNTQLDVALAYLELLRAYGQLAVNADLLARDRDIVRQTREATALGLARTGADINRAETELQLRLEERIGIKGQVRVASSRLARLLLLKPTVGLVPGESAVVPVVLVPEDAPADELVGVGLMARPELAEGRSLVTASQARLRQAHLAPLTPRLEIYYESGVFGGGQNASLSNFNARGDGGATAVWELRNLGLGNVALNRVRRVEVNEATLHVVEVQAQVADEVNSSLQIARARRESLHNAEEAVAQALEMYRKLYDLSIARTGPLKELNTLEPLLALQSLAQARFQYLNAVIEYNRAQFQLFTAMGRPPAEALPKACAAPGEVPSAPAPVPPPLK